MAAPSSIPSVVSPWSYPRFGVEATHIAFADESHYTAGRFRSLAVVSLALSDGPQFDSEIRGLLRESSVTELSWKNLASGRDKHAAMKILAWMLRLAGARRLRADVLTWDTRDVRHAIKGRDDIENLHRMYHHLLHAVLAARWPDDAIWVVRPDENTAMTWERMAEFLRLKEPHRQTEAPTLWGPGRRRFYLLALQPARSSKEPLVQLADLLAGLGAYSRESYDAYAAWARQGSDQPALWTDATLPPWSRSAKERFQVLHEFNRLCKAGKFRVSLDTHHGLRSLHGSSPVNFWWYEPQHEFDRAPMRD
jgi:hypothetical protein